MLKIDYLYCGLYKHDKIYAVASNDTHTVLIYGSRAKGTLKSSIQPFSQTLHMTKVQEKLSPHGNDNNFYTVTDRPDVLAKVNQHLQDIKFTTAPTAPNKISYVNSNSVKYAWDAGYYCRCLFSFTDAFEAGMDYLILSSSAQEVTVVDKYGDQQVLPADMFCDIRQIE